MRTTIGMWCRHGRRDPLSSRDSWPWPGHHIRRAAALDYADKGIRINAVCPGIIGNTPMAARVTRNYDPDVIKVFVAAEPIRRLGSLKRSLLPYCGCVALPRVS